MILTVLLVLIVGGGALTANIVTNIPIMVQTSDPNASAFMATPEQAGQFIFWVFFVLFNLFGAGATIAFLMWRGNLEVKRANAMPKLSEQNEGDSLPEANTAQLADNTN